MSLPTPNSAAPRTGFFAHHGWLAPGIRLFRRLRFPAKSACIALLLVLPLATLLGLLGQRALADLEATGRERAGLRIVGPLLDLLEAAQQHRVAALLGDGDATTAQARMQAAFEGTLAASAGAELLPPAVLAPLRRAREALRGEPAARDPDAALAAHAALTQAVLAAVDEVADVSGLALDPQRGPNHFVRMAVLAGPAQREHLARTAALGRLVLRTQALTPERRRQLAVDGAVLDFIESEVESGFVGGLGDDPAPALREAMRRSDAAAIALHEALDRDVLGERLAADDTALAALAQQALDQHFVLERAVRTRLDGELAARADGLRRLLAWKLGLCGAALALAAYMMLCFYRVVDGGLQAVARELRGVAAGQLVTAREPWGRDEIADLLNTLRATQDALRGIACGVLDGSTQVKAAGDEIAGASLELSRRTEQTAASLQETAASMEQVGAGLAHTTQTLGRAARIVADNASAAERGAAVVDQVRETMDGIAAAAGRIEEIVGTIDGIAFQTNLLALNAAVEAARAGEGGRGFAVVASEVRVLAGRASEAAREVKSLVATSLARTDSGRRVAAEAGGAMARLLDDARHIATLMTEIDAASREQTAGIAQIGQAMQAIDQATQANAALVEESSAAAGAMRSQAGRLAEQAGFFRLA